MITLEQLETIINENFGDPYLIRGGVSAELIDNEDGEKELSINIGRRDIQINASGEVVGAGTFIGMAPDTLVFDDE